MKKYEKEILQAQLNNEKEVLKKLKANYQDALDEIDDRIAMLLGRDDSNLQHVIYQVEYQKSLKKQVSAILETLHSNEFETVSEYLTKSYDEGYIGAMYALQSQGVPLIFPIDQEQVVEAIQHETKLSETLYASLGKDIKDLQKKIAGEISRGISNGATYGEIARNVASWARIPQNRAMTIARTEAHRIQNKAAYNAGERAKSKGANIVRQWDAFLDGKTRPNHRVLDGQIREQGEPFEVANKTAMFPGDFNDPSEDCNCRCALLHRAKWNLDQSITKAVKYEDGTKLVEINADNYQKFKDEYYKQIDGAKNQKQASERVREDVRKMKPVNKNGEEIQFEFIKMSEEKQKMVRETIEELASKYSTNLIKVVDGASVYGKNRSNMGISGIMTLSGGDTKSIVIHEFGHSLASTKAAKKGLQDDSAFWKELRKLHKEYKEDVYRYGNRQYALDGMGYAEDIDEFLAEGFEAALLNADNVDEKYPKKIIAIVDKYFKKTPLENTGKSSTIKMDIQFFAEKTKHGSERAIKRNIVDSQIDDAINNPLFKGDEVIDEQGRKSVKYIGNDATVVLNPDTGEVITTWKTGSRTRKKYGKGD